MAMPDLSTDLKSPAPVPADLQAAPAPDWLQLAVALPRRAGNQPARFRLLAGVVPQPALLVVQTVARSRRETAAQPY